MLDGINDFVFCYFSLFHSQKGVFGEDNFHDMVC